MSAIRWQDDVTEEQWNSWLKFARTLSKAKKVNTSLGAEGGMSSYANLAR